MNRLIQILTIEVLLTLVLFSQNQSTFFTVKFGDYITIELPKSWTYFDDKIKEHLKTSSESMVNLIGYDVKGGNQQILVMANAYTVYTTASATLRLSVVVEKTIRQNDVALLTKKDLEELANGTKTNLEKSFQTADSDQKIEMKGAYIENIGKNKSVKIVYNRIKENGEIFLVNIYAIYLGDKVIRLTLSCRQDERLLFVPVLKRISKSLLIK